MTMNQPEWHRQHCLHLERVRNWKGLATAAVEWLKGEPESAEAHAWLGWANLRLKLRKEARRNFVTALKHDPAWLPALLGLAAVEKSYPGGHFVARETLSDAVQLHPTNALVRARLAELALEMKDRAEAQRHAREAVALAPDWVDGQALRIFAELPANEILPGPARAAVAQYRELLGQDAENYLTWHYLLDALVQEGKDWGAVEEAARTVLRLNPFSREAEQRLFEALSHRRWEYRMLSWPWRMMTRWTAFQHSRWAWPGLAGWTLLWVVILYVVMGAGDPVVRQDGGMLITIGFMGVLMGVFCLMVLLVTGALVAGLLRPFAVIYEQLIRREIEREAMERVRTGLVQAKGWRRLVVRVLPFGLMALPWLFAAVILLRQRDWTIMDGVELPAAAAAIFAGLIVYLMIGAAARWLMRRR
jgi:tetratricopeptide (TPR) repeat protein